MVMTNMTDLAIIVASRVKAEIFRLLEVFICAFFRDPEHVLRRTCIIQSRAQPT